MQWGSVSEFLDMGGYGLYVWGAYAVTAVAIAWEVAVLRRQSRTPAAEEGQIEGGDGEDGR